MNGKYQQTKPISEANLSWAHTIKSLYFLTKRNHIKQGDGVTGKAQP